MSSSTPSLQESLFHSAGFIRRPAKCDGAVRQRHHAEKDGFEYGAGIDVANPRRQFSERDDGSEVKMKFDAPKTAVIGIIIDGVLHQKLNWGLILIGAMLSIGLELCGVGSLAFAVGVYIPMQYTTPIFLGGLVRYFVDRWTAKPAAPSQDEAQAIAESESGPGVLLSSGYIAGGTLADR